MAALKTPPSSKNKKNKLRTEGHTCFFCYDGRVFSSVEELAKALETMDEVTYSHHSNDQRCDFASWVRDVFNKKQVANKMEKSARSKEQLTAVVKSLLK